MKVGIVSTAAAHQVEHAEALRVGLARHGIDATVYPEGNMPIEPMTACWGWRIGKALRAAGKEVLVMERGYIGDRSRWTSVGWNGLNGRATFADGDAIRFWRNHTRLMRRWRPEGDYALIIGQVTGDMSLEGVDLEAWFAEAVHGVRNLGLEPRFRPHPVAVQYGQVDTIDCQRLSGSLADAIDRATLVVTYNSNTGVESMLAGKPTIVFDRGAMAWPVAARNVFAVQAEPAARVAWAQQMAWCQFTLDEIRSGFAWACLSEARVTH